MVAPRNVCGDGSPGMDSQGMPRVLSQFCDPLGADTHQAAREVYDDLVRPQVHDRW